MGILLCLCFLQEVNTGEFRNLEVFCKCNIGCPTFVDVIKIPQFWILTKWQNKARMMMMMNSFLNHKTRSRMNVASDQNSHLRSTDLFSSLSSIG